MDKYEYKIKVEEIKALIAEGQYQQAAEIADEIDWRKVKSVMMLCTVSDLYKINRRFEDSRDLLLLAYDRHPGGRTICYSLCELSIKMGEFLQAMEYYKEFVQIAPKDSGRYILQYKLYEAQDVSLEERIAVLEELKSRDYREKWAYELAYLYHRVGLATRCVEECDELILWFGDGKYVTKAMELKMLHAPLTQEQQSKYDNRFHTANLFEAYQEEKEEAIMEGELPLDAPKEEVLKAPTVQIPSDEVEIQVKTMDVGQYNTINLQKELAEGLKEILGDQNAQNVKPVAQAAPVERGQLTGGIEFDAIGYNTATMAVQQVEETIVEQEVVEEVYEETDAEETFTEEVYEESVEEYAEETYVDVSEEKSLLMGHTGEMKEIILPGEENQVDNTAATVMEQMRLENLGAEPPKEMASVLSMEYDGQITFILPERENVEKQITGQLNIEDIMAEWERMKRENQEKNKEVLRKKVLEQTGPMFTEFEASIRDGVLEQLEKGNAVDIDAAVANMSEGYAMEDDEVEELAEIEELQDEVSVETLVEEDQEAEEEVFEFEEVFEEEYVDAVDSVNETEEVVEEEILEEEIPEEEVVEEEIIEEEIIEEEIIEEEIIEEEIVEEEIVEEAEEELEAEEVEEAEILEEDEIDDEESDEEFEEEYDEEFDEESEEIEDEDTEEEDDEEESEEEVEETEEESEEEVPVEEPTPNVKRVRALSDEEQDVYEIFAQTQDARERLSKAVDAISLASYTGNVVITGEESSDTFMLAKNMLHEVQEMDANFTGRIAKIKAVSLNDRDVEDTLSGLANGALIIHRAADLDKETAEDLQKFLQREDFGLIVVLEDTKSHMNRFLKTYPELSACFTSRMDLEALSEEVLVNYAKKYARDREFSIDELGILALHTRIADLQTSEHVATIADVVEIMEGAIHKASKKNMGHFFDVVFAKRYDDEDMIILREKDFE